MFIYICNIIRLYTLHTLTLIFIIKLSLGRLPQKQNKLQSSGNFVLNSRDVSHKVHVKENRVMFA